MINAIEKSVEGEKYFIYFTYIYKIYIYKGGQSTVGRAITL